LDKLTKYKPCLEVLQRHLCTAPYSAGFGSFLIQKKRKCETLQLSTSLDQLLGACTNELRDFDCYRLTGNGNLTEVDLRELEKVIVRDFKTNNQTAMGYLEALKKRVTPEKSAQRAQMLL
jgi:hypothetical protein